MFGLQIPQPVSHYVLFAHLNENEIEPEPKAWRWLDETDLRQTFSEGFVLERVEHGQTQVGDQALWRSAWFWFKRM